MRLKFVAVTVIIHAILSFLITLPSLSRLGYLLHSTANPAANSVKPAAKVSYPQCRRRYNAEMTMLYSRYPHNSSLTHLNRSQWEIDTGPKLFSVMALRGEPEGILYAVLMTTHYRDEEVYDPIIAIDYYNYLLKKTYWRMLAFRLDSTTVSKSCKPVTRNGTVERWKQTLIIRCEFENLKIPTVDRVQLSSFALDDDRFAYSSPAVPLCDHRDFFRKEPYKLAACTMVNKQHFDRIPEWIEYHKLIGFDHFVFYVNEPDSEFGKFAGKMTRIYGHDLVTLLPMDIDGSHGFTSQRTLQNECIFRMRGVSKWLALHDVDEFFALAKHETKTLLQCLDSVEATLGSGIGGVAFASCMMAPYDIGGMEFDSSSNGSVTKSYINEWKWRYGKPLGYMREKVIVRPENVDYFSVHLITAGGPTYRAHPAKDGAMYHYRWPPLSAIDWEPVEFFPELSDRYGSVISEKLKDDKASNLKRE